QEARNQGQGPVTAKPTPEQEKGEHHARLFPVQIIAFPYITAFTTSGLTQEARNGRSSSPAGKLPSLHPLYVFFTSFHVESLLQLLTTASPCTPQ
ncbi:MAG TPA: hypothetical protein VGG18_07800, partial [Granulicella sp.]